MSTLKPSMAAIAPPKKDESPAVGAAGLLVGKNENSNCAVSGADRQAWIELQAQALHAGYNATLTEADDGGLQLAVSRWALTRSFTILVEAQGWAASVGVRQ